ncbi:MAG: hypothetical protein U1D55_04805 [Phycisphaerae bacterium]
MNSTSSASPKSDPLQRKAAERVRRLLAGRLRRGGISTSRPEWFYECEATPSQAYPGGVQVRVRTWRHWSDASVWFDGLSGEVLRRCIDRLSDPPTSNEMSRQDAERVAAAAVTIPRGARLRLFGHEEFAPRRLLAKLEWEHVHNGTRLEGDYLRVLIHPETKRIVSIARKWREVVGVVGSSR